MAGSTLAQSRLAAEMRRLSMSSSTGRGSVLPDFPGEKRPPLNFFTMAPRAAEKPPAFISRQRSPTMPTNFTGS